MTMELGEYEFGQDDDREERRRQPCQPSSWTNGVAAAVAKRKIIREVSTPTMTN
jgi:hypothetical protein